LKHSKKMTTTHKRYNIAAVVAKPLPRPSPVVMERNSSNRRRLTIHSFNLARACIEAGDFEGAVGHLAVCCAAAPSEQRYFFRRGVCYTKLGQHERALDDMAECTRLQPQDPSSHASHGEVLRALGRYPEAVQAFSKSMELEPEAGDYPKCRGEVYQLMGEHEMAVKDFDAGIKLLETTRTVFHPYVSRGKSHRELGNLALAIKDFGVALSRRPNDIHTMMLQGQVYMQAKDWLNAIDRLNTALRIDPAHANLHDQLGEGCFGCALGYGKDKKQKMVDLDMTKRESKIIVDNLAQLEDEHFVAAENCYNRAIQFDDKEPEFLFHRGKLFLFQKKYEQALDDFQRAAALGGPNLVEYLFHVGHTYAIIGERHHSINAYRKAVLTDATHQASLIKLGRALHLTGDYEQAARLMSSALIADPNNVDLLNTRGCIYRDMMEFKLALKDLELTIKKDPGRIETHFFLGQALLGLEQYSEAHEAFDRATMRGYPSLEVNNWKVSTVVVWRTR